MLRPLDPLKLSALVCDDYQGGLFVDPVVEAKKFLNEYRNLSSGLMRLLGIWPAFDACLYQHEAPDKHEMKGAREWHILFGVRAYTLFDNKILFNR